MGKLDQLRALGKPGIFDRAGSVSRETKPEPIENKGGLGAISKPLTMKDVLHRALARKSDRVA